jgi:hypothetical protein
MAFVGKFLRQAEEILDVAVEGDGNAGDLAILIDRQGGMRMLDRTGWSLPALCVEYGADAVYTVERRAQTVRVEGWGGGERCLIQRNLGPRSQSLGLNSAPFRIMPRTSLERELNAPCFSGVRLL